ncbi:MAG: biopolymer transporter ExbD [Bacteriovoracaceae bacterium]
MSKKLGLGKKKDKNAELNLTPFIDLLSTMVCFLLITAVWIEIGSVEIKQSHGTEAAPSEKISYDLDVVFKTPTNMRLNLKRNGRRVRTVTAKGANFEETLASFNQSVVSKILNYKNKTIEIATATVMPRTGVNYGDLISTLDVLRKNHIINIGVISAR